MKYSIHRALALKKTTEERIVKAIVNAKFIEVRQGKRSTINGVPIENIEKDIHADFDKIQSLISNYIKLKSALLFSNAGIRETPQDLHTVEVAGKSYTMAELISASDEVYGNKKHPDAFKARLLQAMRTAYSQAIRRVDTQHENVEKLIKDYLDKTAANEKGMTSEEIRERSEMFHADRDFSLVDPLNLKEAIEKLDEEIRKFRADCDATMSEQNAMTQIDVDLTEI